MAWRDNPKLVAVSGSIATLCWAGYGILALAAYRVDSPDPGTVILQGIAFAALSWLVAAHWKAYLRARTPGGRSKR